MVDGATVWRQYRQVILPLCKAPLAALATLEFTWIYNDFFWALVLMRTGDKRPVTSALNNLHGQFFTNNNLIAAGALLTAHPDADRVLRPAAAVRRRPDARRQQGLTARPGRSRNQSMSAGRLDAAERDRARSTASSRRPSTSSSSAAASSAPELRSTRPVVGSRSACSSAATGPQGRRVAPRASRTAGCATSSSSSSASSTRP